MKNIFIAILLLSVTLISCEKEDSGNVSKVTYYPTITLNGDRTVFVNKGGVYNELGAVALAGTQNLKLTTTGSVDTNTIGVYEISYSALNDDGFPAKKSRKVVIISPTPSSIDLSGTFIRNGTNVNIVTRISDREYKCTNATGYFTDPINIKDNISLTFYNLDDTKIYAPFQENTSASGLSAESNIGTIVSQNKFFWVIYASGVFGTSVRTFVRQ
jgi:hypothetical protein